MGDILRKLTLSAGVFVPEELADPDFRNELDGKV
jgi:hypothetical protein